VSLWRRVYRERRAVMMPLVALLALGLAVLVFAVGPLVQSVSRLQNEARSEDTSLLRARLVQKQSQDALGSKTRADEELARFYASILPADPAAALKVMSSLQRAADAAGLVFQRRQLEPERMKESQLVRLAGTVTLLGDYANIRKFLYAVETAPDFVIVDRVGLSQAADLRSTNSGRLEVTLDVATYYLVNSPASR
jgi:Tfp pilus assembly protein PilO